VEEILRGTSVQVLSGVRPTCARLDDGLRHRDIQIHVGSAQEMRVSTVPKLASGARRIGN